MQSDEEETALALHDHDKIRPSLAYTGIVQEDTRVQEDTITQSYAALTGTTKEPDNENSGIELTHGCGHPTLDRPLWYLEHSRQVRISSGGQTSPEMQLEGQSAHFPPEYQRTSNELHDCSSKCARKEGMVRGEVEGTVSGEVEGTVSGEVERMVRGEVEGTVRGDVEGMVRGDVEGMVRGDVEGTVRGDVEGMVRGDVEGTVRGDVEGTERGDVEGMVSGEVAGMVRGDVEGTVSGDVEGTVSGDVEGMVSGEVAGMVMEERVCGEVAGTVSYAREEMLKGEEEGRRRDAMEERVSGEVEERMCREVEGRLDGNVETIKVEEKEDDHGINSQKEEHPAGGLAVKAEEYTSPRYVLSDKLKLLAESWKEFDSSNYFRGCKWAPDGSCLLTCNDDNKMRLYNLPMELHSCREYSSSDILELTTALVVTIRESLYDFCWYPGMTSCEPQTCCFLTSCKDHPVHLWDAFNGQNRASYVAYNHLDEVISPHSLSFSKDGERIFAGFLKSLRIFDLCRPGRECRTLSTYARKSGGQGGIISCIAMSPTSPKVYALGSYSRSVGLYSEAMKTATMVLTGLASGITHLMFSEDGQTLYSGFRKFGDIVGWDLRYPGHVLHRMQREVHTNQRLFFDLMSGHYILSGSSNGHVYGYDTTTAAAAGGAKVTSVHSHDPDDSESLTPILDQLAHSDAVNGVSVHPSLPLLATCSGQRHYHLPNFYTEAMDSLEDRNGNPDLSSTTSLASDAPNSLRVWAFE